MNAVVKVPARLPMVPSAAARNITPQQWRVLTDVIFPAAKSPESIAMALDYCVARKLDIFKRPVHIVPMWNSQLRREVETIWPGINEIQITAARTGQFAGMDAPRFGPSVTGDFDGQVGKDQKDITRSVTYPEWCEVTVYRMVSGQKCGFTERVYWLETYATIGRSSVPNDMWCRRPAGQLAKCSKAASLRAAFPEEGSTYAAEEMEGRETQGGIVIDAVTSPHDLAHGLDDEIPDNAKYGSGGGSAGRDLPYAQDKLKERVNTCVLTLEAAKSLARVEQLRPSVRSLLHEIVSTEHDDAVSLVQQIEKAEQAAIAKLSQASDYSDALEDLPAP